MSEHEDSGEHDTDTLARPDEPAVPAPGHGDDFADLLAEPGTPQRPPALGGRPSFFPEESTDQSRAFADHLVPSLRPPPTKSHAFSHDSGLYATDGLRTSEDGDSHDDISTVVLLHARDDADVDSASFEAEAPEAQKVGLLSSLLGQERALADEGAVAAWRTVPLRRRRSTRSPLVGRGAEVDQARAHLLRQLAGSAQGVVRAQLLLSVAELHARLSDAAGARSALEEAYRASPLDPIVVERQLHALLRDGDLDRAAELLEAQSDLPLTATERALALCARVEIMRERGEHEAARLDLAEASLAEPGSHGTLVATLLRAEEAFRNGDRRSAGDALRHAAELTGDGQLRGALLLLAARCFEHERAPVEALALYAQASVAEPRALATALGAYRACRTTGQLDAAQAALGVLAELCRKLNASVPPDENDSLFVAELVRQRARLLHDALDRPDEALQLLGGARSVLGLRAKARAAEATGADVARMSALHGWADAAGGTERALALFELASFYAERGEREAAEHTLHDAALAGAPRGLLGLLREALARAAGDAAGLSNAALEEESSDALPAAAKLARDANEGARELELLVRASHGEEGQLCAQVLSVDAAAEIADLGQLSAALQETAARLHPEQRIGPQLALLDLLGDSAAGRALHADVHAAAAGEKLTLRVLAARSTDPAEAATLWLEEAAACEGEAAAFAATMAGRYLEDAGHDASEAYVAALDAVRGYPPACSALETAARHHGDLYALERVHRELAATTESSNERNERKLRLSLLAADGDPAAALAWLDRVSKDRAWDPLLAELALRIAEDDGPEQRAVRMTTAAALPGSAPLVRAMQLRAASANEDAGHWDDAIALYDRVLASHEPHTDDVFARLGRTHAAHLAGRYDELIADAERALGAGTTRAERRAALDSLAQLELARGHAGRAAMALETLIEHDPADERDVVTLRTLERLALDDRDPQRTLRFSSQLALALDDELDRSAELRLALRTDEALGQDGADALLLASEGRFTHDLWHALTFEAFALRRADRLRFYDAARTVAENLHAPIERAAYAVRAAEAFEAAAPGRAAADLEALLLGAAEHPLATEELARLLKASGEPRRAALLFLRAADGPAHVVNDKRKTQLLYTAGVILHDELSERDLALAAFQRVVALDVLYADVFEREKSLLDARADARGALLLLERRIAAKGEPVQLGRWHRQRADLYATLGERAAAKAALRDALLEIPEDGSALRTLAGWCRDDGEYREAADALVQLARGSSDPGTLAHAFFALGELYDGPLPDPRRAEIAFTRVVALAPDDPRPIERLIALWMRQSNHERAIRALSHLLTSTNEHSARRDGYVVQLAQAFTALGDEHQAEKTLEDARQVTPGSLRLLRALAELYERQHDRSALSVHLVRSCHALRAAIEANPGEPESWQGLYDMLLARGRSDGAALIADAARALGIASLGPDVRDAIPGLAGTADSDFVLRKLMPRGPLEAARALLGALPPALEPFLPAIDTNEHATFDSASEPERAFLQARSHALARYGFTRLVHTDPERMLLFVHALLQIEDPKHEVAAIDADELRQLTQQIAGALFLEDKIALAPKLEQLRREGQWNPRRAAQLAWDFAARLALCRTGDFGGAFAALLRVRGHAPASTTLEERAALAKTEPQLRALLSFAVSEAYLDLRREALSGSREG